MGHHLIQLNQRLAIPRPLDVVAPSANISFSLNRRCRGAYTGNFVRIRRDSDNVEQDFGQKGGYGLDNTGIESFCGAAYGYITTIYDQSGNGNDLVQSTAADQPLIKTSGKLLRNGQNAKFLSYFANMWLQNDQVGLAQPTTIIMAMTNINFTTNTVFADGGSGSSGYQGQQGTVSSKCRISAGTGAQSTDDMGIAQTCILAYRIDGSSSTIQINGGTEDTGLAAGANDPLGLTLGATRLGTVEADVTISELHYFNSALSTADLDALRANLNAFYKAY